MLLSSYLLLPSYGALVSWNYKLFFLVVIVIVVAGFD
jgi:hypothetical protein